MCDELLNLARIGFSPVEIARRQGMELVGAAPIGGIAPAPQMAFFGETPRAS